MVRQKIIHCGKGTKTYYREIDIHMDCKENVRNWKIEKLCCGGS